MTDVPEEWLRLAEALVFASSTPVSRRALGQVLPDEADTDLVVEALTARYAGRGVELAEVGGGLHFRDGGRICGFGRRFLKRVQAGQSGKGDQQRDSCGEIRRFFHGIRNSELSE